MTPRVVVVGSGASGVHFALTLLRKGIGVTMLDTGRSGTEPMMPEANFGTLKETLPDPATYFLGTNNEGVLMPGASGEYYGVPPSKSYVFEGENGVGHTSTGFAPLFSFARGGLAETWTAGCYPLNDDDLTDFPFGYRDLAPHYGEVARRIGITGVDDDLSRFMPLHDHLMPPLDLDLHSARLLESYERARARLNRSGAYVGRTRVATLSRPLGSRQACDYRGRCLWGCPRGAIYTPSHTLEECRGFPAFEYVPGVEVGYFRVGSNNRIASVVAWPTDGGTEREFPVDRLALAAGTLLSTRIVLSSVLRHTAERIRLPGLMDNRQVLMPFLNMRMLGQPYSQESYQYHLLGMGIEGAGPREYVHAQITTLKTALLHPIAQRLPFDLATSASIVRTVHSALGVVNVNFRDTRRDTSYVELAADDGKRERLVIHYEPDHRESGRMRDALRRVKRALRNLGCVVPPGMTRARPMGASVHYAGTLPMTTAAAPFTTTPQCQSRDFENLFLVDGATFPFLPSKNITFTLMANAVRVAETAF